MSYRRGNVRATHTRIDIDKLEEPWKAHFEAEVAANNFVAGADAKSLLLCGPSAEEEAEKWVSCLLLAGIEAYRTTPTEILRRMNGQYIPRNTEARNEEFEHAECYVICDMFSAERALGEHDQDTLSWFIKEAQRDGIVLVLATDDTEQDLNVNGVILGETIEKNFEVIDGKATPANKKRSSKKAGKR